MRVLFCHYRNIYKHDHTFIYLEAGQNTAKAPEAIQKKEAILKKDVVDEKALQEKMTSIERKVDASPLDAEHKEKVKAELKKMDSEHAKAIGKLNEVTEKSLKAAGEKFQEDLKYFEIRPEVVFLFDTINSSEFKEIQKQQPNIRALEVKVKTAADNYKNHLMANGESTPGHEADLEGHMMAIQALYAGLEPVVQQKEHLSGGDESQLKTLEKILGEKNNFTLANFKENPGIHGGIESSESKLRIPGSLVELQGRQQVIENNLTRIRSILYRTTGNPKYEAAYTQETKAKQNVLTGQVAATMDALQVAPYEVEIKKHAQEKLGKLGTELQDLQNLRGKDPINAQRGAVDLLQRLRGFTKGYRMGDADQDLKMVELKKYSDVEKAFHNGVQQYIGETENLILDATTNNPSMKQYQQDAISVISNTQPFVSSIGTLFKQMQAGKTPSESDMKMFHEDAHRILLDPTFNKLAGSDANQFFGNLKIPDEAASPRLHEAMTKIKDMQEKVSTYIRTLNVLTRQVVAIKGHGVGLEAFLKDAGKFLLVTTAAVAGAVAMTALAPATGGASLVAAKIVATSLGAAVGANYMTAAIEGNTDAIGTENMLKSWGQGILFSGGGMIAGQALGTVLGKSAQVLSKTLNIAPDKIFTAPSIQTGIKTLGLKGYLQQVASETKEEIFEEAMQKIGEGLAPNNPYLGFVFSLIPSASGEARSVLHQNNANKSGIEKTITKSGIELTYTDRAEVIQALEQANAPAALIQALQLNESATFEQDGVSVTVRPAALQAVDGERQTSEQIKESMRALDVRDEYKKPDFIDSMYEQFGARAPEIIQYMNEQRTPAMADELSVSGKREAKGALADTRNLGQTIHEALKDLPDTDPLKKQCGDLIVAIDASRGHLHGQRELLQSHEGFERELLAESFNAEKVQAEIDSESDPTIKAQMSLMKNAEMAYRQIEGNIASITDPALKSRLAELYQGELRYRNKMRDFSKKINVDIETAYMRATVFEGGKMPELRELLIGDNGKINQRARLELFAEIDKIAERLGLDKTEVPWLKAQQEIILQDLMQFQKEHPERMTSREINAFIMTNLESLTFQMRQSYQRQLGEHGIRHFTSNIYFALSDYAGTTIPRGPNGKFLKPDGTEYASVKDAIDHGIPAAVKLMIVTGMLNHDLGYATMSAHAFMPGTDAHPTTSAVMLAENQLFRKMFGEQFDLLLKTMHAHDQLTTITDETFVMFEGQKIFVTKLQRAFQLADNLGLGGLEKMPPVVRSSAEMRTVLHDMGVLAPVYKATTRDYEAIDRLDRGSDARKKFTKVIDITLKSDFSDPVKLEERIARAVDGEPSITDKEAAKAHYRKMASDVQKVQKYYHERLGQVREEFAKRKASGEINEAEFNNAMAAIDEFTSGFDSINKFLLAPSGMSALTTGEVISQLDGSSSITMTLNPAFLLLHDTIGGESLAQIKKPFADYIEAHFKRSLAELDRDSDFAHLSEVEKREKIIQKFGFDQDPKLAKKIREATSKKALIDAMTDSELDKLPLRDLLNPGGEIKKSWDTVAGRVDMTVGRVDMAKYPDIAAGFSFSEKVNGVDVEMSVVDGKRPTTQEGYVSLYRNLGEALRSVTNNTGHKNVGGVYQREQKVEMIKSAMSMVETRLAMHIADLELGKLETGETLTGLADALKGTPTLEEFTAKQDQASALLEKIISDHASPRAADAQTLLTELQGLTFENKKGRDNMVNKVKILLGKQFLEGKAAEKARTILRPAA